MSNNVQYPECDMKVAVHMGEGRVNIYGWQRRGFRPLEGHHVSPTVAAAVQFVNDYNTVQRRGLHAREAKK